MNKTKNPIEPRQERVELHCHTKMSAMDGIVSAADLINHAKSLGHTAVAITDRGCVQAFPEAYRASQDTGVKVIYGAEVYVPNHKSERITNTMYGAVRIIGFWYRYSYRN